MANILLLTDLHLGASSPTGSKYGKSAMLTEAHKDRRDTVFADTVEAVARQSAIDAVVIAGDVTYKNDPKGWESLSLVLAPLFANGLEADRVVITPGNHDVAKNLAVDDEAHYEQYLKWVDERWVSPLFDTHDFGEDGTPIKATRPRYLLLPDQRLLVVPINSSHYCGIPEPTPWLGRDEERELETLLTGRAELLCAVADLKKRVERSSERDPVRVSPAQLRSLQTLMLTIRADAASSRVDFDSLTRVAVMHHPTLPVTTSEDWKPYESMSNLALVRQFLADAGFHVLLHGHKHAGVVYTDYIVQHPNRSQTPYPLLVVSGSTLAGEDGQRQAATLLEIDTRPARRAVTVRPIPPARPGVRPGSLDRGECHEIWQDEMRADLPLAIAGRTVSEVYQRILASFGDPSEIKRHLSCVVSTAHGALEPPEGYPNDIPASSPDARLEWFAGIFKWWQRPVTRLDGVHFTHGQRLRSYRSDRRLVDQVARTAEVLTVSPSSTRAVMTLVDASQDDIRLPGTFPTLVFLHATISEHEGIRALDVTGYFRKQEMRYWWPINVAEMASVQAELVAQILPSVAPGKLMTMTSLAHLGDVVPEVNVALIDRLLDDEGSATGIWDMAYAVAHPDVGVTRQVAKRWFEVLDDLEPVSVGAIANVPLAGLGELILWLDRFEHSADLAEIRNALVRVNEHLSANTGKPLSEYQLRELRSDIESVRHLVTARLGDPADAA